MVTLIDAIVTTRSATTGSESDWNSEKCAHIIERTKLCWSASIPSTTSTATRVPSRGVRLESAATDDSCGIDDSSGGVRDIREPWIKLRALEEKLFLPIHRATRATAVTSTTVSHIAAMLRRHHRDERIRRMSPENRAMYERIRELREDIGSIRFDVVRAIREARENG